MYIGQVALAGVPRPRRYDVHGLEACSIVVSFSEELVCAAAAAEE